jgi:hypothetical protein
MLLVTGFAKELLSKVTPCGYRTCCNRCLPLRSDSTQRRSAFESTYSEKVECSFDLDLILVSLQMFELGKGNLLIEVVPLLVVCVFGDRGLVNKRFDQAAFSAL